MGYDVHITRAADWTGSESNPIRPDEWLAFVAAHPELRPDPENGADDFLWIPEDGRRPVPLWWWKGMICTKNPDRATIGKMVEIAAYFRARVQGDEGEVYPTAAHWPERGVRE